MIGTRSKAASVGGLFPSRMSLVVKGFESWETAPRIRRPAASARKSAKPRLQRAGAPTAIAGLPVTCRRRSAGISITIATLGRSLCSLLARRFLSSALVRVSLVRLVMADGAPGSRAGLAMAGHVARDRADVGSCCSLLAAFQTGALDSLQALGRRADLVVLRQLSGTFQAHQGRFTLPHYMGGRLNPLEAI
jgi:hypothetical protein